MKQPSIFIPHGGGPCFFLNPGGPTDPAWQPMETYLAALIDSLAQRPKAILLISGHWEEERFTVHAGERPSLLYDYYGFPPHTYALRWDAPGAPELAHRVASLLEDAGFPVGEEQERGWDHGVFVPMKVAVPDADIPLVQLSLRHDLDAEAHVRAGRALEPLREEGVLIVGSGMSFHNMRERGAHVTPATAIWDHALADAVTDPDPGRRAELLSHWESLANARYAHPREEHLLPLMVVAGAGGGDGAILDHRSTVLGWTVSGYRFG